MVLITGGTLDTIPFYKSTPGDDIFKGQKVITGVCFRPCYAVLYKKGKMVAFYILRKNDFKFYSLVPEMLERMK